MHQVGHIEQQRKQPLQVGGGQLAEVSPGRLIQRPAQVTGQEKELGRPDAAPLQAVAVRPGGELHGLHRELGRFRVPGPGVRSGHRGVQRGGHICVRLWAGGQRREVRVPFRAGRGRGQLLV